MTPDELILGETHSDQNAGENGNCAGESMRHSIENGVNTIHGRWQVGTPEQCGEHVVELMGGPGQQVFLKMLLRAETKTEDQSPGAFEIEDEVERESPLLQQCT